jgi:hypothetical protein
LSLGNQSWPSQCNKHHVWSHQHQSRTFQDRR